jgi:hypothetical protein
MMTCFFYRLLIDWDESEGKGGGGVVRTISPSWIELALNDRVDQGLEIDSTLLVKIGAPAHGMLGFCSFFSGLHESPAKWSSKWRHGGKHDSGEAENIPRALHQVGTGDSLPERVVVYLSAEIVVIGTRSPYDQYYRQ